ncbi:MULTISPECIES: DUF2147 domain-containing protein [unclassified Sphingomonas]|jgi:uncharacterized protein (DUF2147 family)|uniref:DUF2147 domain-containing protein n=1 Tax=unclassified Sphingomonas TaxID=196159 RepID=UPI0006FF0C19|nr:MULTISPECIES: DUF2147 domain-containing protein [unclassified Sphingomonas]KQN29007.1 hypothetical protein ASE88_08470 [Sphingomonas sp. Leaf38]KQN31802.1 hypothetical protein ASF00_03205 [Sphingomonas sp. Leaf34]
MVAALLALAVLAGGPAPASPVDGTWHNPKNSVAVKTGVCPDRTAGDTLCGWVVRADDEAQADARDGGTPKLIGAALLRDYRPSGHNKWSGEIFVPDMGRTFGSTLTLVDANTIAVKGCLVGGFFCKTQTWHRG